MTFVSFFFSFFLYLYRGISTVSLYPLPLGIATSLQYPLWATVNCPMTNPMPVVMKPSSCSVLVSFIYLPVNESIRIHFTFHVNPS